MQMMWLDGRSGLRSTAAGRVWSYLRWQERHYPYDDDQVPLFEEPRSRHPAVSRFGKTRRERMEWAVKFLRGGFELRTGDYRDDIGFDRSRKLVRVATRALPDVYEAAVYMGFTMTDAGEIDWRSTELTPEDFYAA
jgi:hypothetical protein